MRCPKCDQWNRASLPRCMRCGAELTAAEDTPSWRKTLRDSNAGKAYIRVDEDGDVAVTPDDREVLAAEMTELKARKEAGAALQQRMREESDLHGAATAHVQMTGWSEAPADPFADIVEEGVTTPSARPHTAPTAPVDEPRRARNPRGTRVVLNPTHWEDSRSYDPIVEDMNQRNVFQHAPVLRDQKLPSRRTSYRRVIRTVTWLLALGVVCLIGFFGYTVYANQRAEEAEKNRARVTATILDDLAAHTILIPGKEQESIFISNEEIRTSYPVVGGFATIEIPDYVWYEDQASLTQESMDITLIPYRKSTGGSMTPMDPITYTISIPTSPIELISPSATRTEVTTAMYSISLKVRPGSQVIISRAAGNTTNLEVNVTDTVSENGELTYNANVQPLGDNVFNIRVRSPYCRESSITLVLYREYQEIPLDLAATTYTTTNMQILPISCTTLPGADVQILSAHSDLKITNLDTTGEFTFNAIFDKIGYNTISITASYPGKKTSQVDYVIYYVPSPDTYTTKAWPLNASAEYSELLSNIQTRAARQQVYLAVGTIDHFISEDGTQMAVMYCSEDGKGQAVLLENMSKTTWKEGEYYRIYCDAYSTYNGMPWLIARYTY